MESGTDSGVDSGMRSGVDQGIASKHRRINSGVIIENDHGSGLGSRRGMDSRMGSMRNRGCTRTRTRERTRQWISIRKVAQLCHIPGPSAGKKSRLGPIGNGADAYTGLARACWNNASSRNEPARARNHQLQITLEPFSARRFYCSTGLRVNRTSGYRPERSEIAKPQATAWKQSYRAQQQLRASARKNALHRSTTRNASAFAAGGRKPRAQQPSLPEQTHSRLDWHRANRALAYQHRHHSARAGQQRPPTRTGAENVQFCSWPALPALHL